MLPVLTLSVSLALDAAAVSASMGAGGAPRSVLIRMSILFGVFQALMAGIGAFGGLWLSTYLGGWQPWLAFGLLVLVGGQMLLSGGAEASEEPDISWLSLLGLAVATSIDALAAGVSLPMFEVPVAVSLLSIGVVTTGLSLWAAVVSARAGAWLGAWAEKLGGLVLIGLGAHILWQAYP